MHDAVLVLNAGSSSLKFSLFNDGDPPTLSLHGQVEGLQTSPHFVARDASGGVLDEHSWRAGENLSHEAAVEFLFDWQDGHRNEESRVVVAGHRVVHGGRDFTKPVLVDECVLEKLEALVPLAPLHQPNNLSAIRAVAKRSPKMPQVACFDTSFHRTQPQVAQQFAIPRQLADRGIQRYGFHGLSYEYIASQLLRTNPRAAAGRTVVAHLGNGASLCAMKGGASIATTMGFTPLDGLVMGTRCGTIDPGVLLYLMRERGLDAESLEHLLSNESGLLGVSGISSDMRTLLQKEATEPRAAEAIELFVYRIVQELGSMAAALGGLDALIFTGGIGENAPAIRERVCGLAGWLGIVLDRSANERSDKYLSTSQSAVSVWIIPTNEEMVIARRCKDVLSRADTVDPNSNSRRDLHRS